ncbi:NepR family anti-sigma factor [Tropicimonas isoalkanivorans]|uniref:NepR family anti-sigma factor n=1 Tax=Tropicimonas isoalkanivorans TaxID=441112 RepID=UPI000B82E16F|nr:NepR family anti-sigma factor [Tropicimonas isoalkanivorans]
MNVVEDTYRTQIDQNLRRIFEEDARADLPDRLVSLLDRLEQVEVPARSNGRAYGGADGDSY